MPPARTVSVTRIEINLRENVQRLGFSRAGIRTRFFEPFRTKLAMTPASQAAKKLPLGTVVLAFFREL
jgi:hypothetical protein